MLEHLQRPCCLKTLVGAFAVFKTVELCALVQRSSEVFFRKVKFWDKDKGDAPPVFNVDGVNYLYVKVGCCQQCAPCAAMGRIL